MASLRANGNRPFGSSSLREDLTDASHAVRTCVREAKGSLYAHFKRAIDRGNLLAAEAAAHRLFQLSVAAMRSRSAYSRPSSGPEPFEQADARWHALIVLEACRAEIGNCGRRRSPRFTLSRSLRFEPP